MLTNDFRIAKVQKTLRWFEDDIALLDMRVKMLSKERQETARKFAAAVIDETRAELERLLQQNPDETNDASGSQPQPADRVEALPLQRPGRPFRGTPGFLPGLLP